MIGRFAVARTATSEIGRRATAPIYHGACGETMSDLEISPPSPLRQADFEAIEAAVMETEKGRWFLAEYARRNRSADTRLVLDAVGNLERLMKRERRPDADRIRLDIGEMKDAIERTKREIAQIKHDVHHGSRFNSASNELDAIVTHTEEATSEILAAAEKIQEIAWTMRDGGMEAEICDALEMLTTTIYMACSFQDLTGQRTQKVVHVLRYLETRIDTMIDIWGMEEGEVRTASAGAGPVRPHDLRPDAHLLHGPAMAGDGVDQSSVDDVFDSISLDDEAEFEELPSASSPPSLEIEGLVEVDDLDFVEPQSITVVDNLDEDETAIEALAAEAEAALAAEALAEFVSAPAPEASETAVMEVAPPVAAGEPGIDEEEALARAAEAMDAAIETLREVSAGRIRPALPEGMDDPFEAMTRAERQALLS